MSEEELKKEMEELVKNKMDTFIKCYKNGMIFGAPTDIEFYEKIATLQQKVEQLEKENKELRDENKRIFQNVNDDELLISNAMNYAELKKAEKKVEQLENIRKEAIEYVENNKETREHYEPYGTPMGNPNYTTTHIFGYYELLDILNKGSDK